MFISISNIDYSGISTMIQFRNLPCKLCIGGTIYLQGLTATATAAHKGEWIQGSYSNAYVRANTISSDFGDAATGSAVTEIVLFGLDS